MTTQALTPSRRRGRVRVLASQIHVSAALFLAAGLLWSSHRQLASSGRWEYRLALLVAASLAVTHAVLPWAVQAVGTRTQRIGIWATLALAVLPTIGTVTTIDLAALGACQLLVLAAVLAELGPRQRVLLFLWAAVLGMFLLCLWHLRHPLV